MTRDEAIDVALGRYMRELEKSGVGYTSLSAFLSSLAASGYAVVPVEATEEMAAAMRRAADDGRLSDEWACNIWRAMVSAATGDKE